MFRPALFMLALAAGCSTPAEENTGELIADYEAIIDEIRAATQDYVAAVDSAADLAAVTDAQTTYMGAVDAEFTELEAALEGFHDCTMGGDAETRVQLAGSTLSTMHDLVDGLPDEHAAHLDVTECSATADDLDTQMGGHMGDLEEHSSSWTDNMMCMGHDGDEAEPGGHDE